MAVGWHGSISAPRALAELWNGRRWRAVPIPSVTADHRSDYLMAVSCQSTVQCVAVGSTYNPSGTSGTGLAERWNGSRWQLLRVRFPSDSALLGISCPGRTCMIVGQQLVGPPIALQLTGTKVVVSKPALPRGARGVGLFRSVSCAAASSCMAVGFSGGINSLAEVWNGSKWRITATPHPAGSETLLLAVSCPKAGLCLAAGAPTAGFRRLVALNLLWRAGRWHSLNISGQKPKYFVAAGISCAATSHCVAAGVNFNAAKPASLIWNGRSLRSVPASRPAAGGLNAVSCARPTDCIAVGTTSGFTSSATGVAIAELWNGVAWKELPIAS
jgi:hypothetical protein